VFVLPTERSEVVASEKQLIPVFDEAKRPKQGAEEAI